MAAVNSGELLLIAQAYFCHCRGLWKGQPEKPASQTFKQVVWRLLDWTPWGQKPILPSFFFNTEVFTEHSFVERWEWTFQLAAEDFLSFRGSMKIVTFSDSPILKMISFDYIDLDCFPLSWSWQWFCVKDPYLHMPWDESYAVAPLLSFRRAKGESLVREWESIIFCQFLVNLMKVAILFLNIWCSPELWILNIRSHRFTSLNFWAKCV